MSDTDNNQNNQQNTNRTFTQDELNAILQTRLADERKKYADYDSLKEKAGKYDAQEEANKSELQKANEKAASLQAKIDEMTKATALQDIKAKVSKETGVPVELLSGSDEAACKAQADAILERKRTQEQRVGQTTAIMLIGLISPNHYLVERSNIWQR